MSDPRAASVRRMFDAISPRYDFLNHFLSAGVDVRWRRVTAERVRAALAADARADGARVLDVCCGTGDLAFAVREAGGGRGLPAPTVRVVGVDFSLPMLGLFRDKSRQAGASFALGAADALRLPFRDGSFDACLIAFGLRNVVDPPAGLREMRRVLRPGGHLFVLEFGVPRAPGVRQAYGFYFNRVLPWVGRTLSGADNDAYSYLPRTVAAFPDREALAGVIRAAGFAEVSFTSLTCGVAILYQGRRGGGLKDSTI